MTMTSANGSTEFRTQARAVVESFLHTAVILDDLAEMPRTNRGPAGEAALGGIVSPDYPQSTAPPDRVQSRDPRGVPLDAESVIDGFAEIGSVCAVLKANPDDGFRERTVSAARRADIVILDWRIHDSTGDEALRVLREIVQDDGGTGRLRLIAIYTGEPNLRTIYERVRDAVGEFYEGEELREAEVLRMSRGPLHVVVLAKPGVVTAAAPEFGNQEVAEGDLAERLANEFAEMTGGLIRNVAIAGIAGIRDNAHRILAKFEPSLDPAYLGHRLLLHHPPEAADHIEGALSSEIASVLGDHRPGRWADGDAIESWLAHRDSEGLRLSEPLGSPRGGSAVSGWRSLLDRGFEAPDMPDPGFATKGSLRRQATEPFTEDPDTARRSNLRFAALLTLKTHYPGRPPRLSIGSVLHTREGDQDGYFLCLQPKCDSVRLRDSSGFPFIPLVPLTEAGDVNGGMSLRLVVEGTADQWDHFGIEAKPSELTVRFFRPGNDPPGEVVAQEESEGRFFFEDTDERQYRWIAQMKDEHALGVAGEVAAALARPGPNDAEWLRRAFGVSP